MVPVAFLGICDSSNGYADFFEGFWRQDFIGVRRHVLSPVFPWALANEQFLFALYEPLGFPSVRIRLVDPRGEEVLFITFEIESKGEVAIARSESAASVRPGSPALVMNAPPAYGEGTKWITIAITPPRAVLVSPGEYRVEATVAGVTETIGCIDCIALSVPPLSDEVATAIKADPLAAKEARLELACNVCEAKIRAYAALARSNSTEQGGFAWYQDLPDRFACSCGRLTAELDLVRRGLHGLLGRHMRPNGALSLVPMYQRTALENVVEAFMTLLDGDPEEERVQEFLSANPVVLGQFAPQRLLPKAPILNKYKTDFTLVNHRSELVLIELERPGTKLLKADGGVSAQLQAPLDQVYDWLHEVDEHFHAVLSCLSLVAGDISAVRAIVVAGRDRHCDATALRKLKKRDFGRKIDVLTYDDLVAGFANLIKNLGS